MDTAEMERLQYKPLFGVLRDLNVSLPMLESLADHDTPELDLTAYATYVTCMPLTYAKTMLYSVVIVC